MFKPKPLNQAMELRQCLLLFIIQKNLSQKCLCIKIQDDDDKPCSS